jgi:hypothetical protein
MDDQPPDTLSRRLIFAIGVSLLFWALPTVDSVLIRDLLALPLAH